MAEFRRLISYIYEYEGNVKGKNVGFVKLEARNGMCRLNVNVKKLYMGSGDMGVYLLTGRQEIFLGNMFLRNGSGEFRAVVQVADVQDSGETMDECYGLTIHGREDNWRVYTTIWEDAVAQTAQLTLAPVTSEQAFEHEAKAGKLSSVVPEGVRERGTDTYSGPDGLKEKQIPETKLPDYEMGLLEMETRQPDLPLKESERIERKEPDVREPGLNGSDDTEPDLKESGLKEPNFRESGLKEPDFRGPILKEPNFRESELKEPDSRKSELKNQDVRKQGMKEMGFQEPEVKLTEENTLKSQQEKPRPVIRQYREEPLIIGDPEVLAKLDAEDAEGNQVPIWDFLSKTYPKIQAFDSEHGCEVLVIKPQDIGLLPREIWIYGNNSFLLHGYYNYRYLILARLENPKGAPRYLLGVPGHYYSNEKYMASMFGFPQFVLSKKQTMQNGRFGYWYTDIRLEEEASDTGAALKENV